MKPTPEQLVVIDAALGEGLGNLAQAGWDVIAPMVLEAAAREADDEDETSMASWIRALK